MIINTIYGLCLQSISWWFRQPVEWQSATTVPFLLLGPGADPEISFGGHKAPKASRIEAPQAPRVGWGVGRGCPPSPPGEGSGSGAVPPPQKIFSILHYKVACFGRFWCATCTVDRCCQIGNVHVKCEMSMCRWSVTGTKTCRVITINTAKYSAAVKNTYGPKYRLNTANRRHKHKVTTTTATSDADTIMRLGGGAWPLGPL